MHCECYSTEDYLREIARAGLVDIAVVRTKTIAIPNDVLKEHLDKTTIQKYKKGNVGIYSITVTESVRKIKCQ